MPERVVTSKLDLKLYQLIYIFELKSNKKKKIKNYLIFALIMLLSCVVTEVI